LKILTAREVLESNRARLETIAPEVQWVLAEADGSTDSDPEGCEVLYWSSGIDRGDPRVRTMLHRWNDPALRWVQSPGAGTEHDIWQSLISRGITFTNASGVHGEPIGQYVISWILAWSQGLQGQITRSRHHEWTVVPSRDLHDATVGIVGYGGIGSVVARIAQSIGMHVIATRRSTGGSDHVDEMLTPDRLPDLLARSDYVVICVPASSQTDGMFDSAAFARMKPESVVINVARGSIVDEDALTDALTTGRIRGATLDVTIEEPLPPDSLLWDVPRLVITPHQSSTSALTAQRLDALFLHNLGCYLNGTRMRNLVNPNDALQR